LVAIVNLLLKKIMMMMMMMYHFNLKRLHCNKYLESSVFIYIYFVIFI